MASYQILERDGAKVTVTLTADNGYSEVQSYIPPEGTEAECLAEAARSFNQGIMAQQAPIAIDATPEVFPVVEVQ